MRHRQKPAESPSPEATPLVVPTNRTDTAASATNNDAQAVFVVALPPSAGLPATGSDLGWLLRVGGLALAVGVGLAISARQRISTRG